MMKKQVQKTMSGTYWRLEQKHYTLDYSDDTNTCKQQIYWMEPVH